MIICCGESLIDMLPTDLDDGRKAFVPVPGGALFNTAIALGRLGQDTGFVSGVSTDMFGQQLIQHLQDSHVSADYCVRSPNHTTLAFVTLVNGSAQYSFLDENTAGRMLDVQALPVLPAAVNALHFGGISLMVEPCGATFEHFMGQMKTTKVISFDPNIRPGFISDEQAYRARLQRMLGMSDIIKVSEEDLDWIAPGGRFEDIAQTWIEGGATIVTLTMGGNGARSVTKTLDVSVAAPAVVVADTVGAGDTFNAGFLASLNASGVLAKTKLGTVDEDGLRAALERGVQVAAYTVGQVGANPPWRDQL